MKFSFVAAAVAAVHALPTTHGSEIHPSVAKRVLQEGAKAKGNRIKENLGQSFPALFKDGFGRRLADDWDVQPGCDQVFAETCLLVPTCVSCFGTLATENIDWATVAPHTPCHEVVDFLFGAGYCQEMKDDDNAVNQFCKTFDGCVVYDDNNEKKADKNSTVLDCSKLQSCDFDGMRPSLLGDGICHDALPGCYNSAACNYDGGDCCRDTCTSSSDYKTCGSDGFACRDPKSETCDPMLSTKCPDSNGEKTIPDCSINTIPYKLNMYDSFGDGWDETKLFIAEQSGRKVYEGSLENGFVGTDYVCLSSQSACYDVAVRGGVWGNEVSWEIKSLREGTPPVAGGGAPMRCEFPVSGNLCEKTCNGHASKAHIDDDDYTDFKHMYECIKEKCIIQVGTCMADATCMPCLTQDTPEYCFNNDNFNAIITCGLCQCRDDMQDTEYCDTRASHKSDSGGETPDEPGGGRECSPQETIKGTNAVVAFSECTEFDQVKAMVTDYDQDNFGTLDVFENCAHTYKREPLHGGYHALGCMKILADAIDNPSSGRKDAPLDAISSLARLLYHEGEKFCDCAKVASDDCPLCPSFLNFKTLLYESLDACTALDEIDCDAWAEFYPTCRDNLLIVFERVDFSNPSQCDYVRDSCGGAGTFPAFRRLDCGKEVAKSAWDFYRNFASSCLGDDVTPSTPSPTTGGGSAPAPTMTPGVPTTKATPEPTEQYVPPDDDAGSSPEEEKLGSSHFWRNMLILAIVGGVGYVGYKKRQDTFTFIRYRRAPRNNGMVYSGLDMSSSTNFEPPTLPPPPSAMPQQHP